MQRLGSTFGLVAGGLVVMGTGLALLSVPIPVVDAAFAPSPRSLFATDFQERRSPALELRARSVPQLKAHFARIGYAWERAPQSVPRVRLSAFPPDLADVRDLRERKRLFFQTMLPLILLENERIQADRQHMLTLFGRVDGGLSIDRQDDAWLRNLARKYQVTAAPTSADGRDRLLRQVNVVPQSLALAMAAHESAWGTSRFVEQGNNLFGQWTFTTGSGLVPEGRQEGMRHEVAVFPDLASSVRAYLRNLNTHWAHDTFRRSRETMPSLATPEASIQLALTLTRYSERGAEYTEDLVRFIRRNRLTRFDGTTLQSSRRRAWMVAAAP
ncbi:MAG: glucosaminidase domain-containing protein [Nitrospirae bacterium]|nr:glucosaminidase domain-containing protein [Nitrospirota bacterium]